MPMPLLPFAGKNADHLTRYLREKVGLEIEIISGEKECLSHLLRH